MKISFILSIMLTALVCGCTYTHLINEQSPSRDYSKLNDALKKDQCRIKLVNDERHVGINTIVANDSISWVESSSGQRRAVPAAMVGEIMIVKHDKGALQGMGIGALIGATVGLITAFAIDSEDEPNKSHYAYLPAGGAVGGALLGAVIGSAVASKEKFIIDLPSDSSAQRIVE